MTPTALPRPKKLLPVAIKCLSDFLNAEIEGQPVVVQKYRAHHPRRIDVIDALWVRRLYIQEQNTYLISFDGLLQLRTRAATKLLADCEKVFRVLSKHYRQHAGDSIAVRELSSRTEIDPNRILLIVKIFARNSPLSLGRDSSVLSPDTQLHVSEAFIRFTSFTKVRERALGQIISYGGDISTAIFERGVLTEVGVAPDNIGVPPPNRGPHNARGLPERVLHTYSRLWQLETWLRRMVYVELRALMGDNWTKKVSIDKAERPQKADKELTHMPTPEEDPLSYVQLSELRRIIRENRRLFDPFLPPEKIWDAKLDEVSQVRHRVAHFRQVHEHDLDRVMQLLRDIDKGFWRFCTSYNDIHSVLPQTDDPVVAHFLPLDLRPWCEIEKNEWARVGSIPNSEWFWVTVETTLRPWATWTKPVAGKEGILYDVTIFVRGARYLDYTRLLEGTRRLHRNFVHLCLDSHANEIRMTIPAVLGEKQIIEVLDRFIEVAHSCTCPGEWPSYKGTIQHLAASWPEYVLEPYHPLTLLTSDMPCSIFDV